MENVNGYVHGVFSKEVERSIRLEALFPTDMDGQNLLAAVSGSKHTVESYTDAFNSIVDVCYSLVEHKLFALPKLMLLPGMLWKQPMLVVTVLPISVALDVGRSKSIAMMTKKLEKMVREIQELAQRRTKVEQHDTKQEELIRRGAASTFVKDHWHEIAVDMQSRMLRYSALSSLRAFINALYKQDLLMPGIEILLAWLLEAKLMPSTDIWVYTRVVEDAIDALLTRFRMDATLASMKTKMERVTDLSTRLEQVRARGHATCIVNEAGGELRVEGLHFTRGPSHEIKIPQLVLRRGRIYKVTGANGSGKSSLFGVLASCGRQATVLPDGLAIENLDSLVVPSDEVVEVMQQLYCPLFTKPIAWMLQNRQLDKLAPDELEALEQKIISLSSQMALRGGEDAGDENEAASGLSHEELHEEADDWYSTFSGGQRVKVELIRKVFLKEKCPGVLLIDEAFAPLDPSSKAVVQKMMKTFCAESLLLVIYHSDTNEALSVGGDGFFDETLHFSNGTASLS